MPRRQAGPTPDAETYPVGVTCSCCGEEKATLAALQCHPEVKICRSCAGWLRNKTAGLDVTPTLPVRDLDEASAFYEALGFEVRRYDGGGFGFVHHEGESTFDLDLTDLDPAANRASCYIVTDDVDGWHGRVTSAGVAATVVAEMEWGMREFELFDPSNNRIRFGSPMEASR